SRRYRCGREQREAREQPAAALTEDVSENEKALLALRRQLRPERAEGERQQEPAGGCGDRPSDDQRGSRNLGIAEPEEDQDRPGRRPERGHEVDSEHDREGDEQVRDQAPILSPLGMGGSAGARSATAF